MSRILPAGTIVLGLALLAPAAINGEDASDLDFVKVDRRADGALEILVETTASSGCYDAGSFERLEATGQSIQLQATVVYVDGPCMQSVVDLRFETLVGPDAIGTATDVVVTLFDERSGGTTTLPPVPVPD